jgi:hypothetical protein
MNQMREVKMSMTINYGAILSAFSLSLRTAQQILFNDIAPFIICILNHPQMAYVAKCVKMEFPTMLVTYISLKSPDPVLAKICITTFSHNLHKYLCIFKH